MSFRENLKKQLVYSGVLVKELAVTTGISLHTLETYLNIRSCEPSAENACRIARALGVTVEYLVTGSTEEKCATQFPNTSRETLLIAQCAESLDEQTRKTVLTMVQALQTAK